MWLWRLRDIAIGGLLAVFGVAMLAQFGSCLFAAIVKPQFYRWGSPFSTPEVTQNKKAKPVQRKKKK